MPSGPFMLCVSMGVKYAKCIIYLRKACFLIIFS